MIRKILALGLTLVIAACSSVTPLPPPTLVSFAPPTATPFVFPTFAPLPNTTSAPAATVAAPAKTVRGGLLREPESFVSLFSSASESNRLTQLIFLGLAERNEKGELVPELAETIPSPTNGGLSKDNLSITWKLRKDLKWSDGSPLTSRDVKATWQALMDSRNLAATRNGYDLIESIDTPDNVTVVLKFKTAYPDWQNLFTINSTHAGIILPEALLKGKIALEAETNLRYPRIASGPYLLTERKADSAFILIPNPNFYKGKPKVEQVELKTFTSSDEAIKALQNGTLDWYLNFSEADLVALQKAEKIQKQYLALPEYEQLFFNLGTTKTLAGKGKSEVEGHCALKDLKVRKAFALGINRAALNDKLLVGKAVIPATPWSLSAFANPELKADNFNLEAAKKLLDDAGYKVNAEGLRAGKCGGKDITLTFNLELSNKKMRQDLAQLIQADLNKLGVNVITRAVEASNFFGTYNEGANLLTGKYDLALLSYPETLAPEWACFSVPSKENPSGINYAHFCDPAFDKLLTDINAFDPAARQPAFGAVQRYFADNYLGVMIYARLNIYAFSERFVPAPFGVNDLFWNAEAWDVK